ncbi:MAG: acetate/propionate family kinase [Alphaproteobacteria bacterium]|jgi:acetate kinase|nr:acetate kinase [Alphaproteobacteria bacterium]
MTKTLLALNAGSSSMKFALYGGTPDLPLIKKGSVQGLGTAPLFYSQDGYPALSLKHDLSYEEALTHILDALPDFHKVQAVVHRVVHGGDLYTKPVFVTPDVIRSLKALIPLAPLHQPHNLHPMEIFAKLAPNMPQIAAFDTAFHAHRAELTRAFALSPSLRAKGMKRYGFHGLSYEWIIQCLSKERLDLLKGRVVAAHLGSGASVCAMQGGKSVDTSMGMTALDGLPMGTRCGSLDPGAILYMLETLGMYSHEISHVLYHEAGLKGLSGVSNDVKVLLEDPSKEAAFALEYFVFKTAQFMAMMAVSMGGVDAYVFSGGIGEKSEEIRRRILEHLAFLGEKPSLVFSADEEKMMALHAYQLLNERNMLHELS